MSQSLYYLLGKETDHSSSGISLIWRLSVTAFYLKETAVVGYTNHQTLLTCLTPAVGGAGLLLATRVESTRIALPPDGSSSSSVAASVREGSTHSDRLGTVCRE